jgi:hypothetical protein
MCLLSPRRTDQEIKGAAHMKVLYAFNVAGAFSRVAKYLNSTGHKARIIGRSDLDVLGLTKDSGCAVMVNGAKRLYLELIKQIFRFRPNIIHVSSSMELLRIARRFAPRTPIIMSYHGTDIRGKPLEEAKRAAELADFIHVTTPDLQMYGEWIDRVIGEHFYYRGGREDDTALMYYSPHFPVDCRNTARRLCLERELTLTFLDSTDPEYEPIPNKDMPHLYSKYEYYLDLKGIPDARSLCALEALACGCKVIHDPYLPALTSDDYPLAKVDAYITLYEELMKR